MKKVAFHTLGCKVNQYETEAMEEMFARADYEVVDGEEIADIYIINTCTVTNISDRKSRQFIRRAKRNNENAVVAVVGCYSQTSPEEIEDIEEVDVIIGTANRDRIVDLCEQVKETNGRINIVSEIKYEKEFEEIKIEDLKEKTRAYIKIQDGCNQFCSYCIIPYARGPIRSRGLEDVIREVEKLSLAGFKEVVLTGIHVASYGLDMQDEYKLHRLIKKIAEIDGIERIRFSSLEPRLIDDEFMQVLVDSKKACDHFHLSIQSGSDSVLESMNRKYTTGEFEDIVNLIRTYMPEASITTDVIVGFPRETDENFEETYRFVEKIGFSRLHVFKYSPRKGTPAAEMKEQVDGNIKNQRSDRLIELGEKNARRFNESYLGRTVKVLIEDDMNYKKDSMEGYTSNYIRVRTDLDESLIGRIVDVRINELDGELMLGQVIK